MRQVGKVKKTLLASQCEGGKGEVHRSPAVEAEEVAPVFSDEVPRSACEEGQGSSRGMSAGSGFLCLGPGSGRAVGGARACWGAFHRRGQVGFSFLDWTSRCTCAVGLHFSRVRAVFSRAGKLVMKNPEMRHLSHLCPLPPSRQSNLLLIIVIGGVVVCLAASCC